MASAGRGIVGDAQLFSLAQAEIGQAGTTTLSISPVQSIDLGSSPRVDFVVELRASADTEWQYTWASDATEAGTFAAGEWVTVAASTERTIPTVNPQKNLFIKAALAGTLTWEALGFKKPVNASTIIDNAQR